MKETTMKDFVAIDEIRTHYRTTPEAAKAVLGSINVSPVAKINHYFKTLNLMYPARDVFSPTAYFAFKTYHEQVKRKRQEHIEKIHPKNKKNAKVKQRIATLKAELAALEREV